MITARDKYNCAKREVKLRRRVYADRVERLKMSPDFADRQIELMEAIAEDYRVQAEREEAQALLI